MADYVRLDESFRVTRFHVVSDAVLTTDEGEDSTLGCELLASLHGEIPEQYVRVEREATLVSNGWFWHPDTQDFRPPQPFDSWVFNETDWVWEAPVPQPAEGVWDWDEEQQNWSELILPPE